jgi:ATP-dependent 26S proteasome regulatory subunit
MDGLDEDHDVLFVLTTNRADLLEPALAARPGRIDQAVELPLPDGDGRRRLLELYGEGLELTLRDDEALIASLEGVSPAFIRELLRRAALLCAEESDGALSVSADHLERALAELRHGAGDLTNALLGARPPAGDEPVWEDDDDDDD